jgi:hypothetical protein
MRASCCRSSCWTTKGHETSSPPSSASPASDGLRNCVGRLTSRTVEPDDPWFPLPWVTAAAAYARLAGLRTERGVFRQELRRIPFRRSVLRFRGPPVVSSQGRTFEFSAVGSRDVLCALIGQTVELAEDGPDRLALTFPQGIKVEMLKTSAGTGPEVAYLASVRDGAPHVASMVTWENRSCVHPDRFRPVRAARPPMFELPVSN